MKKPLVLAVVVVAVTWGLGFGVTVRYQGNPRILSDSKMLAGAAFGPGLFSIPGSPLFLDSSRNQFGIYLSRIGNISSNGANVVGILLRQYLTSSGWIELFTSVDTGSTWVIDPNSTTLRSPHIDFTAPDRYGFLTGVGSFPATGAWYIRNSGGYGSGFWDTPVEISNLALQNAQGVWVGNLLICVPMEETLGNIPFISEVIDTNGDVLSPSQTLFDQNAGTQDCRDGKVACLGGGPSDGLNLKTSTDGGLTWTADSITIYAGSTDTAFYDWANVILQDGSSGALLAMDNTNTATAGSHSALQFFHKGHPKVTVFTPNGTQGAAFPMISRKDDNTLVAVFMFAPTWNANDQQAYRTFWDIGESHSTDGGLTWSSVRSLTNTPTVSECCPHLVKFIGTDNKLHITYGTSQSAGPSDTVDIWWSASWGGNSNITYNWYLRDSVALGVETRRSESPRFSSFELGPVSPNPIREFGTITYQLPAPGRATLAIYNALGQRVRTLVDRFHSSGRFSVSWDGRDEESVLLPSGVYLIRFEAGPSLAIRQVILLR